MTSTEPPHRRTSAAASTPIIFVIRTISFGLISAVISTSFTSHRRARRKRSTHGKHPTATFFLRRHCISSREFLSNILPNSDKKPFVLFGSTNFCLHCRQPLAIFRSMEKQFNDVGIGTAEFNVNDQRLAHELGILNAPALCVVSQRRVYHFNARGKTNDYTETNIKEFVRQSMPVKRYIQTVGTNASAALGIEPRMLLPVSVAYLRGSVRIAVHLQSIESYSCCARDETESTDA